MLKPNPKVIFFIFLGLLELTFLLIAIVLAFYPAIGIVGSFVLIAFVLIVTIITIYINVS